MQPDLGELEAWPALIGRLGGPAPSLIGHRRSPDRPTAALCS